MIPWTKHRLELLIADKVEENLSLEYKSSGALDKAEGKRTEMTKDVSAFANSAGGVLIYGIAESPDKARRHLPDRLDPIQRASFSKEWLEQVTQNIQPRIQGLVIHPVVVDEPKNQVCYVLEIPQSHTAHQARDHVYYKRQNFNVLPMEDYEIRDVMNRRTHPRIRASLFVNKNVDRRKGEGVLLVKIENIGQVLARHVMVEVELPMDMNGLIMVEKPVIQKETEEGVCYQLRLALAQGESPVFPGSEVTLRRGLRTDVHKLTDMEGRPVASTRTVGISVFADEMIPIRATLDFAPVIMGWVPVGQSGEPVLTSSANDDANS
jgi:hypothetical protein